MKITRTIAVIAIMLSSCNIGEKTEELGLKASVFTEQYYNDVKNKDYDQALSLFSAQFLRDTPRDSFITQIARMRENRGDIISFQLEENKYLKNINGSKKESEFTQIYKVTYSKGLVTRESFVFFVSNNGNSLGKIKSYEIDFYKDSDNEN